MAGDVPLEAPPPGNKLPALWQTLAEPDAVAALTAVGRFVAAEEESVAFLTPRLHPVEAPLDRIRELIPKLDDDAFEIREAATLELANYSSAAVGELRAALAKTSSPEVCLRLHRLLDRADSCRIHRGDELQIHRAICVLERIGSDTARRALSYLATGAPLARQTRQAAEALERIAARRSLAERIGKNTPQAADDLTGRRPQLVRSFGTPAAAYQAGFSPKDNLLATGSGDRDRGQVIVWNMATGDQVRARLDLPSAATCLCFSPCGRLLVAGGGQVPGTTGGWLSVWDLETGDSAFSPLTNTQPVYTATISPDGGWLAAAGYDGLIRVWELATGQLALPPMKHPGNANEAVTNVFEVVFSADGRHLASGGGGGWNVSTAGKACLWDAIAGTQIRELSGHTRPVFGVALSPCGTRLATASGDQTVRIWDAKTGESLRTLQATDVPASGGTARSHAGQVYSVVYSPDGRHLASADNTTTWRVWDAANFTQLGAVDKQQGMYRLTFGPGGKTIARTGKVVEIWRLQAESQRKE